MENLSKEAAQAGVAIDIARQLETALEAFGATGKGLHEKTSSVEGRLPKALATKLRFVASVRNKIVHEDDLLADDDFSAFAEAGRQAVEDLKGVVGKGAGSRRAKPKPRKKASPRRAAPPAEGPTALTGRTLRQGGLMFIGGLAFVFLLMLLGNDGPGLWAGAFAAYFLAGWHLLRRSRRGDTP